MIATLVSSPAEAHGFRRDKIVQREIVPRRRWGAARHASASTNATDRGGRTTARPANDAIAKVISRFTSAQIPLGSLQASGIARAVPGADRDTRAPEERSLNLSGRWTSMRDRGHRR